LISLLNYRADVYIVATLLGAAQLGMYTLAVTAAEMLLAATQVTATVSSPKIGAMESARAAAELAARCVRHNVLIAAVTCGGLLIAAPIAIRILYGSAFSPMIPAFRILLLGVFALSLGSPMSTYFTIRMGKPQIPLQLAALSASICIVCALLLVGPYGLVGAALGSTLGYMIGQGTAIAVFMRIGRVRFANILIPRWSDVTAYADASSSLLRRLRRAA
jgi:O-antigen/teichoic acid export membrane protein